LLSLFALSDNKVATGDVSCRSNATHVVWKSPQLATMPAFGRRRAQTTLPSTHCQVQLREDAEQDCLQFLQDNLMAFDMPFQETMGFPVSEDDGDIDMKLTNETVDGLGNGLVGNTVKLALDAKVHYPWTDDLPKHIFFDYVLNYANLNEARSNWRPLIVDALKFNESDLWQNGDANLTSVVTWVNTHLWTRLGRQGEPIYFKSSQTPLIFDPMSTIAFGYASCTGTSILFANGLRAVGVPARVAGTPAWYGNVSQGNHNWVEVYDHGVWKFLEPSPALPHVDTLDTDPCARWFCKPSRFPSSRVDAARLSKHRSEDSDPATHFPLAWEWDCLDVPAVDRTQYYAEVCRLCEE
jgi:hypothetical protein